MNAVEIGVAGDLVENRRRGQIDRAVAAAGEDRSQVEAKSIDLHLLDPIAQAVDDQPADGAVGGLQGVAGAAVVGVGMLAGRRSR